ncbi:MAG: uroporphyrinogen-III C-methyltransferase [Phycisphaerales bacterium]|nr:MAG: uroporphyrinogen-III C-methyltransferase [Phycisphaerales bacterium]
MADGSGRKNGRDSGPRRQCVCPKRPQRSTNPELGTVYLVGAGPGDPDLFTVRGHRLLAQADVIVHDRLISRELLDRARGDAEIIDVRKTCGHGERAQSKINTILVERAKRGLTVVRLKGGDPFVFGRGWEEWCACRGAAVPCTVVPGITSALAVPAAAGIPITHRGTGRAFAVVAAQGSTSDEAAGLDYGALAKITTVVILMGRANLAIVAQSLIKAGRNACTPAACIERGTTPRQRSVVATLGTIAEAADREGLRAPVVTVVGEVVHCAGECGNQLVGRSVPNAELHEPLAGRRVVITRSTSSSHQLRERLTAAGAITIDAPMIRIEYPPNPDRLDAAIANLGSYQWIAFASVHSVRGFFERLATLGQDARALSPCKVAAIGPITASALNKRGIRAELVARPYSTSVLADDLLANTADGTGRVLCPCGDTADSGLPQELRRARLGVDGVVVYRTVTLKPEESALRAISDGVDAVLCCSPSAARRFARLGIDIASATVACIGPSTASAARAAGMPVAVTADEHTDRGLVAALAQHFRSAEEAARLHVEYAR